METTLYFFSATGNSLAVAKKIQERIQAKKLISIPKTITDKEIHGDTIGIICPIYMYNLPHIVADFIKKIKSAGYLFLVFSGGGELGTGIQSVKKLFKTQGLHLNALFNISMPSNYAPYGCPEANEVKNLLNSVDEKIEAIEKVVKARREHRDSNNTNFFKSHIFPGVLYRLGYKRIKEFDGNFYANDDCNGCGICKKVCPVNNINILDDKPAWNHNCQQCFACLQWCPKESIQYGKRTVVVNRYHHPKIKVNDIIESGCHRKKNH